MSVVRIYVNRKWPSSNVRLAIAALVSLLSAIPPQAQAEPVHLDLPQSIELALHQNRSLMISALDMDVRRASVRENEAAFSMRLDGSGGAAAGSDQDSALYGLGLGRTLPVGTEVGVRTEYGRTRFDGVPAEWQSRVRVEASQPLFRGGGRLVTMEPVTAALSRLLAADRTYHILKADLILAVVERYLALEILERQIQVDEQAVERLDKVFRIARSRERAGAQTRVDTLRVELELGQASARLENNRRRLVTARESFADLLGLPVDTELMIEDSPLFVVDIPDSRSAVLIAFQNRLDLAQIMHDLEDTQRGETITRRNLRPDVRLTTFYDFIGRGETASDAGRLDDSNWFIGLTMGSDWLPARERARVEGSVLDTRQAALNVEDLQYRISLDVRERLEACRRTRSEHAIAVHNAELAEKRRRLAERLYELGRGTNFDLIDAESALIVAETQKLVTEADITLASYRLLHALGTLLEFPDDLKPLARRQP